MAKAQHEWNMMVASIDVTAWVDSMNPSLDADDEVLRDMCSRTIWESLRQGYREGQLLEEIDGIHFSGWWKIATPVNLDGLRNFCENMKVPMLALKNKVDFCDGKVTIDAEAANKIIQFYLEVVNTVK